MKTRCINLKDQEARGILDGSITALWRPVKPQPGSDGPDFQLVRDRTPWAHCCRWLGPGGPHCEIWGGETNFVHCPWGEPGGYLIGRETFRIIWSEAEDEPMLQYRDGIFVHPRNSQEHNRMADFSDDRLRTWRSSQTMPQWASRIRRELVAVECKQVRSVTAPEVVAMFGGSLPAIVPMEQWFWKLSLSENH